MSEIKYRDEFEKMLNLANEKTKRLDAVIIEAEQIIDYGRKKGSRPFQELGERLLKVAKGESDD